MKIAIVWVRYVVLPLLYNFSKVWFDIIGFDVND